MNPSRCNNFRSTESAPALFLNVKTNKGPLVLQQSEMVLDSWTKQCLQNHFRTINHLF